MTALGWPESASPPNAGFGSHLAHTASSVLAHLRGIGSAKTLAKATWIVAFSGGAIVALLALRVWMQLMGETSSGGLMGFGYELSGVLASPFASFEPTTPIKDNGILEFSTLVAIEAYLIATMVALTVLFSARLALMAAPRVVHRRRPIVVQDTALVVLPETPKA